MLVRRNPLLLMPLLTGKKQKELGIPFEGEQKSIIEGEPSSMLAETQRRHRVTNIHYPSSAASFASGSQKGGSKLQDLGE